MTDSDGEGYTSGKVMSVNLGPISARRFSVGAADDPYKKYWWAILAGFVVTGAWLCVPIMETPVGSIHVDTGPKAGVDAASVEQSLDSADGPSGAPGGAVDLSMDGVGRKSKAGDDMMSMLYQAPPSEAGAEAAAKSAGGATSAASLAQQLKDVGAKSEASGWGEKAQRGFGAPRLSGGGLSGSGSASGGSSASAYAGAGNIFGARTAQVGFGATRGLRDDGSADSPGFRALKASVGAAGAGGPNLKGSNEAAHASMSQSFDGAKGRAPAPIGTGAMAQANAAYDAAPANLKANDPRLDSKKLPDPPMAPPPPAAGPDIGKQLMIMAATALIGGMIGGIGGQMVMSMGTMMMQQQQQAAAAAAQQQQSTVNNRYGVKPS